MSAVIRNKLNGLQILRALAALGVVLFHMEGQLVSLVPFERILSQFAYSGVDLFFVISGFVLMYVHGHQIGQPEHWRAFMLKRLIRIYPAYWLALLAAYLLYYATDYRADLTSVHSVADVTLIVPQDFTQHMLSVAWTLNYELFFYLLFSLCMLLPKRASWLLIASWCAAVVLMQPFLEYRREVTFLEFVFASYHLEFLAGTLAAWLIRQRAIISPVACMMVGFLALGVTVCLSGFIFDGGLGAAEHRAFRGLCYAVSYGFIVYAAAGYNSRRNTAGGKPGLFTRIGDASYSLYLWHVLLLYGWHKVWTLWMPPLTDWLLMVSYAAGFLFLSVGFSLLFYRKIEQPLLSKLRGMLSQKYR